MSVGRGDWITYCMENHSPCRVTGDNEDCYMEYQLRNRSVGRRTRCYIEYYV